MKKISGERNTVAVIYLYFSTKFDTVFHKTLLKNIIQTRRARSPVVWGTLGRAPHVRWFASMGWRERLGGRRSRGGEGREGKGRWGPALRPWG